MYCAFALSLSSSLFIMLPTISPSAVPTSKPGTPPINAPPILPAPLAPNTPNPFPATLPVPPRSFPKPLLLGLISLDVLASKFDMMFAFFLTSVKRV